MLALALTACRTTQKSVETTYPTLKVPRPPLVPDGLLADPQTDVDLLHNSVRFEFLMYDWQDYAIALEDYMQDVGVNVKAPP